MKIGEFLRKGLGPLEKPISEAYRAIFFDLGALILQIKRWIPGDRLKILEVGCGEGMLISRLAAAYPDSQITGIDITPSIGRMYKGDMNHITFSQQTIMDFSFKNPESIDLLIIADVMHHVPKEKHKEFLLQARNTLKRGGYIVLKDWARNKAPIHRLAYFSDRYITGDEVYYRTAEEWRGFLQEAFGRDSIKEEARIRPWSNNIAFLMQP